jgi:hypothetical protein
MANFSVPCLISFKICCCCADVLQLVMLLAEVYALLKQKDLAAAYAEKAYAANPQSSEVRNLLLFVDPAKWTEKLRTVGV